MKQSGNIAGCGRRGRLKCGLRSFIEDKFDSDGDGNGRDEHEQYALEGPHKFKLEYQI